MAKFVQCILRNYSKRNPNYMIPSNISTAYMEAMYSAWLRDPNSVHRSWDIYFRNCPVIEEYELVSEMGSLFKARKPRVEYRNTINKTIDDHAIIYELVRKYQTIGYTVANLNPLETKQLPYKCKELHEELNFLPQDWERDFRLPRSTRVGGKMSSLELREIIKHLDQIYCNKIGNDFMFIDTIEERNWIRDHVEVSHTLNLLPEKRRKLLVRLLRAVEFEKFFSSYFPSHKNASLLGCEILIPALKWIIDISNEKGVESFILGLPKRGRLNILANVCKKSLKEIISLFNNVEENVPDDLGDLKYTLGTVIERFNWTTNKNMRITVVGNPMHMEAFVPEVLGKARAEQSQRCDDNGGAVMPIIIHDDSAFYGQGIAYETVQLSKIPNYTTQGTIHIVMNTLNSQYPPLISEGCECNTPNPSATQYCKNISRITECPVFHVNVEDVNATMHVCTIAAKYRARFHKDVIIQLVGYRHPHDNCDVFADPTTCQKIQKHTSCLENYKNELIADNVITADDINTEIFNLENVYRTSFDLAKLMQFNESSWREVFPTQKLLCPSITTGVDIDTLIDVGRNFLSPPKHDRNFVLSKLLHRIVLERQEMLDKCIADWTLAEALAFGTLLIQGIHVRLAVQSSERDAFSKRHHLLHHQLISGKTYNPLESLDLNQASYTISYIPFCENAILGFEHGYSVTNPNALVICEAPIGDLTSSAQLIIDHYIATAESKWGQESGLVMLLPHGVDSKRSDQSSGRLERYLQMCSDDFDNPTNDMISQLDEINWIVANCTTPANYFHILRRQMALPFRKPLIIILAKSLVEHNAIKSPLSAMTGGHDFQPVISDELPTLYNPSNIKKLIFCSGRIYYDLIKERAERRLEDDIAIVRIEQLAPFPYNLIKKEIDSYENASLVWVQEEHKNQGAWPYVQPRLQSLITDNRYINYVGRRCSSLTATVSKSQYYLQQQEIIGESMSMLTDFTQYW